MKLAILGASGWIGSTIVEESLARGHEVIALVRDPAKIEPRQGLGVQPIDLLESAPLPAELAAADVMIASIGGRAAGNHELTAATAKRLLEELPAAGIERLFWVGGAGSLEVAPGVSLLSTPEFPAEYKNEAQAQSEALQVFRTSTGPLAWTFISPAAEIFPGEKVGHYRVGGDALLTDTEGRSRISVTDYAAAMLDQVEQNTYAHQRIGVAY